MTDSFFSIEYEISFVFFIRRPKSGLHFVFLCGMEEKKKTLNEIMRDFADEIKQEAQESMKANLVVLLKEKYGIILSDDEWKLVINN